MPRHPESETRAVGDDGMTVIELAAAMVIFSIVMTIFFSVLIVVQSNTVKATDRSISNDEARLALQQIDREIRSGNVFQDPATDPAADPAHPGLTMRIYSQANFPSRPSGHRCVQWRIADEQLQTRSWDVAWQTTGDISGWRIVSRHIVNRRAAVPAFTLDTSTQYGGDPTNATGRVLRIDLVSNKSQSSGDDVLLSAAINGRNTRLSDATTPCTNAPPA